MGLGSRLKKLTGGRYGTLLINTLLFGLSTFSSKFLGLVMMKFYTAHMTTAETGTADLITTTANMLAPIAALGITESIIRFGLDKETDKRDVFSTGLAVLACGFAVLLCFFPLLRLYNNTASYIWLVYLYVLCSCLKAIISQFVRSQGHVRLFAIDGVCSTLYVLVLNVLSLGVFHFGVTGYILSTVLSDLISSIALFCICKLWHFLRLRIDKKVLKAMILYSLPMIPNTICWQITNTSDRYMVTYYCGVDENGIYAVASRIPSVVTAVSVIFNRAWQMSAFKDESKLVKQQFYSNVFKMYQTAIFSAVSAIILLVQPVTRLLTTGEDYYSSWRYAPFLIVAVGFSCFSTFLGTIYMDHKKNMMAMVTTMIGAGVNLLLNFLLIPKYGPYGGAFATFFSYFTMVVLRLIDTRKLLPLRFGPVRLFGCTALVLAQCVICILQDQIPLAYPLEAACLIGVVALEGIPLLKDLKTQKMQKAQE
jgi:O-antigen/teichoic acid export membrane protein